MTASQIERTRALTVRQLFAEGYPHECTGKDVLLFYAWLGQYRPSLLPHGHGDKYQLLKVDLAGLFED